MKITLLLKHHLRGFFLKISAVIFEIAAHIRRISKNFSGRGGNRKKQTPNPNGWLVHLQRSWTIHFCMTWKKYTPQMPNTASLCDLNNRSTFSEKNFYFIICYNIFRICVNANTFFCYQMPGNLWIAFGARILQTKQKVGPCAVMAIWYNCDFQHSIAKVAIKCYIFS